VSNDLILDSRELSSALPPDIPRCLAPETWDKHGIRKYRTLVAKIQQQVDAGALEKASHKYICVSAPIFAIPQKGGKVRIIYDARYVSKFMNAPKFKLP
jgi:hypothetical protein